MNLNRIFAFILTSEQGARYGWAAAGLFALLAFLSLCSLLGAWWTDARLASLSGSTATLNLSATLDELLPAIPAAHLFGYRSQDSAYMPITSSQLRLTGIMQQGTAEDEGAFSKAIISVQGGVGKVFQVGDVLQEGVKLTGIEAEAVILDNNGHSERLPMQRARLGGDECHHL